MIKTPRYSASELSDKYINLDTQSIIALIKQLMDRGISNQTLLNSIIHMPTTELNPETGNHEPSQALINKQTEIVQFLIEKGANFNDVSYCHQGFLKNNFELVIKSNIYPSTLSNMMSNIHDPEQKFDLLLKLLEKKIEIDFVDCSKFTIEQIKQLMDRGISNKLLLNSIIHMSTTELNPKTGMHEPSQALINKQTELVQFVIKEGANLDYVSDYPQSFLKNHFEFITKSNIDPRTLSNMMSNIQDPEERFDLLLKLLERKIKITSFNCDKFTIEQIKQLMDNGISKQILLNSIIRMSTTEVNPETYRYEPSQALIKKQTELVQFVIREGANLNDINYYPASFLKNNFELVIESNIHPKILSNIMSSMISDIQDPEERFDLLLKLLDKTTQIDPLNCNKFTIEQIKQLMDRGISNQTLLHSIIKMSTTELNPETGNHEPSQALINKQTEIVQFLIEKGANFNDVSYCHQGFLKNNFELVIKSNIYPSTLSNMISDIQDPEEKFDLLLKLLEKKIEIDFVDCIKFTIEQIKQLMDRGMSNKPVLNSIAQMHTTEYNSKTGKHEFSQELIEKQNKMIQLFLTKTTDYPNTLENIGDTDNYSINLLWLNDKKNSEQQYIHPSKTQENLATKLLTPAIKWAKANPTADINIWYDSNLHELQSISNTQEVLASLSESCTNIKLRDIREISVVRDNSGLFADGMPLYLRVDLLKLILCLYSITNESKSFAVFTDLEVGDLRKDGQRMNKAELFNEESLQKLGKVGVIVNLNQGYDSRENQFVQVINNEHMVTALKHAINVCLIQATTIWNDTDSFSHHKIEKMHEIAFYTTIRKLSKWFVASKYGSIEVRADFVGEGTKNEWVAYNPNKHGYKALLLAPDQKDPSYPDLNKDPSEIIKQPDILKLSDPWCFLLLKNLVRIVDVRNGNSHNDKYTITKREDPISYTLWNQKEAKKKAEEAATKEADEEKLAEEKKLAEENKEKTGGVDAGQEAILPEVAPPHHDDIDIPLAGDE